MDITPFVSVGNLLFSDSREEIRKKLSEEFQAGVKEFEEVRDYYDFFKKSDLIVYYDKNDNITGFEFYDGDLKLGKENLLKMTYIELVNLFSGLDPGLTKSYNDFTSNKYGIGGSTSDDPEDENTLPTALIVFRKGYYDSLNL